MVAFKIHHNTIVDSTLDQLTLDNSAKFYGSISGNIHAVP